MAATDKIVLEVPETMAQELATATQDFLAEILQRGLRETRIERALSRYRLGGISFAATAEAAGVSQAELARHAYIRHIEPPFDAEMLAEEMP
jgi:predicted HTH domain antitoxin